MARAIESRPAMRHPIAVLSLSVAVSLASLPAEGGDVTGRVIVEPAPVAKPAAAVPAPPEAPPEPAALVYVENAPEPAGGFAWPKEFESPRVEMRSLAFRPREVIVRAGGSVAFENGDDLFHQPFSCSRGNRFDLGRYRKGEAPVVEFREPGLARVYCEVHSGMRAFVLVARNPYCARVAPDGTFRIAGVPPGRHVVAIAYEGDVLERRPVEVAESGDAPPVEWRVAAAPRRSTDGEPRTAGAAVRPPCCAEETAAARR